MKRMIPVALVLAACSTTQPTQPVPDTVGAPLETAASGIAADESGAGIAADTAAALDATASPGASTGAATAASSSPLAECQGEKMQAYIGVPIAQVSKQAPANLRIITPSSVVTQDYRPDRLNVYVDDAGKITRLTCG